MTYLCTCTHTHLLLDSRTHSKRGPMSHPRASRDSSPIVPMTLPQAYELEGHRPSGRFPDEDRRAQRGKVTCQQGTVL